MNLQEKLEELNIDKGQIIIFSVIGLVIVFLLYGLFSSGSDDEIVSDPSTKINMPENRAVDEYNTKLDAYAKENQGKENTVSLDFDRGNIEKGDTPSTKRERLEQQVDSMLAASKISDKAKGIQIEKTESITDKVNREKGREKNKNVNQTSTSQLSNNQNSLSNTNTENNIDINDFFNKKVTTPEVQQTNVSTTRTDVVIYAVVHNDQNIKDNDRVTLRLTKPATINDIIYKENTFIYGFSKFGKNRVYITVDNVNQARTDLVAYDTQDGSKGLYIQGANTASEVLKKSGDEGIDESDIQRIPGGRTISNVFKKKNKEVSVFLLNNYEIILKNQL